MGLLKTEVSERKANFPVKKQFWPIFSPVMECGKPQGTFCKGLKGLLTFTVEIIRSFLSSNT